MLHHWNPPPVLYDSALSRLYTILYYTIIFSDLLSPCSNHAAYTKVWLFCAFFSTRQGALVLKGQQKKKSKEFRCKEESERIARDYR